MKTLERGMFVRVRSDLDNLRAGKDGMVLEDYGDEVSLSFGRDRYNQWQNVQCVGIELWRKDELDLETAE